MTVVLVGLFVVQDPHSRRQLGWHVDHTFTGREQLLGEQRTGSGGALDRPCPWRIAVRPLEQSLSLMTVRRELERRLDAVPRGRSRPRRATPRCGSIPIMNMTPPWLLVVSRRDNPDGGLCRSCFEPHRNESPAGSQIVRKRQPLTRLRQGILEPTDQPPERSNPATSLPRILHQGTRHDLRQSPKATCQR